MRGGHKDPFDRARLDDFTVRHHTDAIGNLAHDTQIMGDEQDRHSKFGLEFFQQREDLSLDRDIESGRGLIGDQEIGIVRECHRNHDALTLPTRQLVRIAVQATFWILDTDEVKKFERASPRFGCGCALVEHQSFCDLLLDPMQWIERGHRLLKDHRDPIAPNFLQRFHGRTDQLVSFEPNAPRGM